MSAIAIGRRVIEALQTADDATLMRMARFLGVSVGGPSATARSAEAIPPDPLVDALLGHAYALYTGDGGAHESAAYVAVDVATVRISAVIAAARAIMAAGPHSDLAAEIGALERAIAAADRGCS